MSASEVFKPNGFGNAVSISATSTSASGAMTTNLALNSPNALVSNTGSKWAFIRWGKAADTTVTALTTDVPIAPGGQQVFFTQNADTFAAITGGSDATTINVYPGVGQ